MYSSLLSLQIQTWLEKKSSTINKLYLYLTNMIFEEFVKKDRIFLPFFFKLSIETTLYNSSPSGYTYNERNNPLRNLRIWRIAIHSPLPIVRNKKKNSKIDRIPLQIVGRNDTFTSGNWKENSRNLFPTMLIQSNDGNNRSLKTRFDANLPRNVSWYSVQ